MGGVSVANLGATNGYYDLQITVSPADMSIFDNAFDALAASADCANDAMRGQVPLDAGALWRFSVSACLVSAECAARRKPPNSLIDRHDSKASPHRRGLLLCAIYS